MLVVESTASEGRIRELEDFMTSRCVPWQLDPLSAVESITEESTLIIFMASGDKPAMKVYSTNTPPEDLLCHLINSRLCEAVDNVCTAPGTAVMRLLGDVDKAAARIAKDLGGELVDRPHALACPVGTRTIIYFTQSPLNRPLRMEELHPLAVMVERPCSEVLGRLKENAMDYLSMAMGTPDWNHVEIKIYDAAGRYDLHYQRLMGAIEGLDAGLVLSEAWGRDQAFILMSVPVYVVSLFTPLPPSEVKEICTALEYSPKGDRWVDLDVIHQGKKVSWTSMGQGKGDTRDSLGLSLREKLLPRMSPQGLKRLMEAESKLMENP
ncbi:hypothetical protein TheveDRAFT_1465 [Thermanaerovibrio velox DSM 12556]|uniref:Uncharacterized protein n=1 Tax=Thermanaerovibrio velox DSM 12556 TaxID=926567 RepID=H0UPF2_9BACT|nr:hypothetical protein TheveDRAFT_1465 [Thermanaerovibrio velox DSM 12556]